MQSRRDFKQILSCMNTSLDACTLVVTRFMASDGYKGPVASLENVTEGWLRREVSGSMEVEDVFEFFLHGLS